MSDLRFETEVLLPAALEEVFPFFADAQNLEYLTPPWLEFRVVTPPPIAMEVGTRIDYRLRLRGIRMSWTSEITAWSPPRRFVDEQRRGPYRRWVHEHLFEAVEGGTLVRDRVHYAVPGGKWVAKLFVRPDLERIFRFRHEQLSRRFGRS